MRKFKLTASALLVVSAIGLAGCGHQHTFSEKWSSNSTDHWHEATCEHAGQVVGDQAKHVDSNSDGICDVCDRVLGTHQHSFGTEWKSDASQHWHECACGEKGSVGDHIDTNKDGKCDFCGANVPLPPHEHSFESKWTYDAENHWHKCTGCDEVSNKGAHVDANNDGICDLCNYDKLPITPTVVSVRVSGDTSVYATKTIQLTATVEVQGTASKDVTWSSSNSSIATVSESGLVTGVEQGRVTITATSVFDNTKKGELVVIIGPAPSISYVRFVTEDQELNLGETLALEYDIASVSEADDSVTFSSSNPEVATVSEAGLVNALAEGEAIITVASVFDPTKTDTVTLNVIDMGFNKALYEAGYTYVKEFPVTKIKEFVGEGEYDVVVPKDYLGNGAYYLENPAQEEYAPYLEVIIDGALANAYANDLIEEGFNRVYQTSYGAIETIDPANKYTLDFYCDYDEETYEDAAPTYLCFYKCSDIWEEFELTTDTAWEDSHITNEDPAEIAKAKEWVAKVPFVALGEDYLIEYVLDDSAREQLCALLEAFGFDVESMPEDELNYYLSQLGYTGPEEYLIIADFALLEPFANYPEALETAGYKVVESEEGDYYQIPNGLESYDLSFYFCEYGNTIVLEKGIAILDTFPTEIANNFIENVLGSENSIPEYNETEGGLYKGTISGDELIIACNSATVAEATAYATKLEGLDFEVEFDSKYLAWTATKGKLVVVFCIYPEVDEKTGEMLDNGELDFFIFADPNKHEEQGIYLPETSNAVLADGKFTLDLEIVKLEEPTLVVESSNPEVATVDGLDVTPVAEGTTTITVSIPETDFSASTVLTVSTKTNFDKALEECNEWLTYCGAEEPLELPAPTSGKVLSDEDYFYDEEYNCYSIFVTGAYADAYFDQLESAGFVIGEEEDIKVAFKGDVVVVPYDYDEGLLEIDIYYEPASSGGQVFDVDDLYDGAEICITCLDQGYGLGAYEKSKRFAGVELGDSFDGCTVFTLKDNGDGTWGLFDEDGNQYGADKDKNIKTSGSGVDFDWTIEIDEFGDATLSCNGYELMFNSDGNIFKTYTSGMSSGYPVQIFFADGTPGGGGGGESSEIDYDSLSANAKKAVDLVAPFVMDYYECSFDEITLGDYEDEESMADIVVYDESDCQFCSFWTYTMDDIDTTIEYFESLLPSGYTLDDSASEIYEDDGYYDLWYTNGQYYIIVNLTDWSDDEGSFVSVYVDAVLVSQADVYYDIAYQSAEE